VVEEEEDQPSSCRLCLRDQSLSGVHLEEGAAAEEGLTVAEGAKLAGREGKEYLGREMVGIQP